MDSRKLSFLKAVVGEDGARALAKATGQSEDLEWAIFPRVVMSWLDVVSHHEYTSVLPGTDDVRLSLRKNADTFVGSVNIGDHLYAFNDSVLEHVAGAVAVALGVKPDEVPALQSRALAKLGKSIDLLVRARTLRKMQQKHSGGARGAKAPGQAAAPIAPTLPAAPQPTQPANQQSQVGTKVALAARPQKAKALATPGAPPKLPGITPKKPTLKVNKSEATRKCTVCAGTQFKGDRYTGCICFSELAKSVKTRIVDDNYVLEFGPSWDGEAITTLAENLGK